MSFYDNQKIQEEGALSWDSPIEKESSFELFPEGIYQFQVTNLERDIFDGSEKMSACPMAKLTFKVKNIKTNQEGELSGIALFLHSKTEWVLSAFFTSIGQKKPGEALKPNWNDVVGSKGVFELSVRKYISKSNGQEYENNEVKKYFKPEEAQALLSKQTKETVQQTEFKGW